MSDAVTQFEQAFAAWAQTARAFAFWKGRVAMYALLRALGVGEGDEVILPGYTCVMDVNPIKYLGAKPVYVDIEPATYNMDPRLLPAKITPRTKVIVAQHTYGYPCEMDALLEIARGCGAAIVEDCCLAMGSRYKGRLCGTMGRGAYWSFQWNKPFTTGLGGMATTSDPQLAARMDDLCRRERRPPSPKASAMLSIQRAVHRAFLYPRTTALATSLFRWLTHKGAVVGSSCDSEFTPKMAEDFFRGMGAAQARAGLRGLRKVERNLAHRREMRKLYEELLPAAGWKVPAIPAHLDPVLVRYPLRVADKARAVAEAPHARIELGTWFECPLHPIETPMRLYDYEEGMCPVAEKASREVVNLPTHPRAGRRTAERTVKFVAAIGPPGDHALSHER